MSMTTASTEREQFLEEANYANLQIEVDALLRDLVNERENVDKRRRRLLEQSREFKKNTSEDVRKLVAPLFNSFRTVVDDLYQSNKYVEAALLKTCPKLLQLLSVHSYSYLGASYSQTCAAEAAADGSTPPQLHHATPLALTSDSCHHPVRNQIMHDTETQGSDSWQRQRQRQKQRQTPSSCSWVQDGTAPAASKSLSHDHDHNHERLERAESELELKDKRITQLTEEVRKLRAAINCFASSREPIDSNVESRPAKDKDADADADADKATYSRQLHKAQMNNPAEQESERPSSRDCLQNASLSQSGSQKTCARAEASGSGSGEKTKEGGGGHESDAAEQWADAGELTLDTVEIAARVRQTLLENNIGQRVFAKFVLNLSQGTLSELMSKPKRWDKLTEKGRESYRKMLHWLAATDVNVAKLKLLIPKKNGLPSQAESPATGVECASPSVGQPRNCAPSSASDVSGSVTVADSANSIQLKVKQILEDVRVEMQRKRQLVQKQTSCALHSTYQPSRAAEPELALRPTHESRLVRRVYIEQLAKLVQKATELGRQEDVADYQQQLDAALLRETGDETNQETPLNLTVVSKTAIGKRVKLQLRENDEFPKCNAAKTDSVSHWLLPLPEHAFAMAHGSVSELLSRLNSFLQRSNTEPQYSQEQLHALATFTQAASLSQETLSVSNCRFETSSRTPSPSCNYVLPTQVTNGFANEDGMQNEELETQLDIDIDTNALTMQVRDLLAMHSVGQKLFGQFVLGLSQGSVSEILSKPKPWNVLSAKGREPYVKMRRWLDDPCAIDRLKHWQSNTCRIKRDRLQVTPNVTYPERRKKLRKTNLIRNDKLQRSASVLPTRMTTDDDDEAVTVFKGRRHKGQRVIFSEEQKTVLNRTFEHDPYPSQQMIHSLAKRVGVTVRTIVNWFHNHRVRSKHYQSMKQAHQMRRKLFTQSASTVTMSNAFANDPSPSSTPSPSPSSDTSLCVDSLSRDQLDEPRRSDEDKDKNMSVASLNSESDVTVQCHGESGANDSEERSQLSDDQCHRVALEAQGSGRSAATKNKRKNARPLYRDAKFVDSIHQS